MGVLGTDKSIVPGHHEWSVEPLLWVVRVWILSFDKETQSTFTSSVHFLFQIQALSYTTKVNLLSKRVRMCVKHKPGDCQSYNWSWQNSNKRDTWPGWPDEWTKGNVTVLDGLKPPLSEQGASNRPGSNPIQADPSEGKYVSSLPENQ